MTEIPKFFRDRRPTDWQEIIAGQARGLSANSISCFAEVSGLASDVERALRHQQRAETRQAMSDLGYMILVSASQSRVYMSNALALKYPGYCLRCQRRRGCQCKQTDRLPAVELVGQPQSPLVRLSLPTWQSRLHRLYYQANKQNGLVITWGRLMAEIGEAWREIGRRGSPSQADHYPLHNEFADVFAWWLALVNLLDFSAEELLYEVHSARINSSHSSI